ncbi:hypothetical protein MPSEU_000242300 [Mayamaea pseudoterrestris]|nr:hypothetical protein MPSEU_000242300 [Mayamaea pseudoterrestris]
MKTTLAYAALCTGAAAFAPVAVPSRSSTRLTGWIPEADMTTDQLEIKKIAAKWSEVRLMDAEQAESLEPEWKEAHTRYYEKFHKDMEYAQEVVGKLQGMIEPPKLTKKSKSQKKRDKWLKIQERESIRATNAAKIAAVAAAKK